MNTPTVVTSQSELDDALTNKATYIVVDSPAGVQLSLRGSSSVEAWGSSSVVAWGSSSVEAWDSSSVEARGSSRVEAWDSSSVVARGSSSVEARGSSRVEARDSSSVVARDSSSVEARPYVAVHLHSARVTLTGEGHLIDLTTLDLSDKTMWESFHGASLLLADDGRGYRLGYRKGLWGGRYFAGCRDFGFDDAVAHWSSTEHDSPESASLLLAAVQNHHAQVEEVS